MAGEASSAGFHEAEQEVVARAATADAAGLWPADLPLQRLPPGAVHPHTVHRYEDFLVDSFLPMLAVFDEVASRKP
jgi:hypothetical protein